MTEQPNYYAIIPSDVRYDHDLKANEKLLYGEITALANTAGCCWATNSYFAKLYGVSPVTVSNWISHLSKKGYLVSEFEYKKNTKEIEKRLLYIQHPINKKIKGGINQNIKTPINKNVKSPLNKNIKENITSINNTSINNNNNKGVEKQTTVNAFETLQKANISLNGITTPIFLDYVESLGNEVVDYAINKMCSSATRASWGYLKVMLNDYEEHNVKTLEQIKKLEADFEAKKEKRVFRKKKVVQKEALPDWAANPPEQSVQAKPNEYTDEQRAELTAKLARLSEKGKSDGTNEC